MPIPLLPHDIDLLPKNISELENAERLRDLFGRLAYDTSAAGKLDPARLNITGDLLHQIMASQHLATGRDDDSDLRVVLLEMRSIAAANIQALAKALRQKHERYLLVLTTGYDTFKFVLMGRAKITGKGGVPRYVIRPRVLTVERRIDFQTNPGNTSYIALRTLERLSYTEPDDDAQWKKLQQAFTDLEWTQPDFRNRALFSDYYLKERLTDPEDHPIWKEDVRDIGNQVRNLIAEQSAALAADKSLDTHARLIQPLLIKLGFADPAKAFDSTKHQYTLTAPGAPTPALAIAVAYQWDRNLDAADPTRDTTSPGDNPGAKIVSLLEQPDMPPWVILTNGKLWRLYSTTAPNKITNYYEVDLEDAFFSSRGDPVTAFKYWWLIFRRAAFTDGLLDQIISESKLYARDIGAQLKERIFEDIFGYFAGGFVDDMINRAGITRDTVRTEHLDSIYHATMTFLYRLMFILYAESRDLLSTDQDGKYAKNSLRALKEQIASDAGTVDDDAEVRANLEDKYDVDSTELYGRIRKLCAAIDKGDPDLNLPVYNGGLFSSDSDDGAFLEKHAIPDLYLAIGLDRLARDQVKKSGGGLVFIDYKSLGVRELGSIYEGLLEFKVRIATEDLAIIKEKGREFYLPHVQAVQENKSFTKTVRKDRVYIENTKHERKATGSYYTPDYIVNYIVQHTIGPVLEEKFAALRQRLHDTQRRYRQHRDNVKGRKDNQNPELFWTTDADAIQLADDCLNIRVLDPAMGSGHFLVAAVDFISNRLIDFLNAWSDNPVWALLERTRKEISDDLDRMGVEVDKSKLTRVVLLKRSVLKRCVYGVDLNAMAVELAKVSLWLDAFTLGAPLSFLDHHLKHGNSLIGSVDLSDVVAPGSVRWNKILDAAVDMVAASRRSDSTKVEVDQSKAIYLAAQAKLEDVKKYANVQTGAYFVEELDNYRRTAGKRNDNSHMIGRVGGVAYAPTHDALLNDLFGKAQAKAADHHFFHWKLEFPEVFVDLDSRSWKVGGGFDAVVGNPPYVRVELLSDNVKTFLAAAFKDISIGRPDIYLFFIWQSVVLSGKSGRSSMITPNKFATRDHGELLRRRLLTDTRITHLIDLAKCPSIFPDATVYPLIFVLEKGLQTNHQVTIGVATKDRPVELINAGDKETFNNEFYVYQIKQGELGNNDDASFDIQSNPLERKLVTKLEQVSSVSSSILDTRQGIIPGDVSKFVVDSANVGKLDTKQKTLLKPVLSGSDLERFNLPTSDTFIIYDVDILTAPRTPTIFERPKIVMQDMSNRMEASIDRENQYGLDTTTIAFKHDENSGYLLEMLVALLNSSVIQFYMRARFGSAELRGGYLRFRPQFVDQLPVRRIDFTTPAERRAQLLSEAKALAAGQDSAGLLAFTGARLAAGEADVIHDLLAHLAEQMIAWNKQKQAGVRRFLSWLEETLEIKPKNGKTGIDSLNKKSYLQNFLGDYQKGERELPFDGAARVTLWYCLLDNQRRFNVVLSDVRAAIEDEYAAALKGLLPLKAALSRTDALIDRIVYQLYGLTDDEIRLIEYPGLADVAGRAPEIALSDPDVQPQVATGETPATPEEQETEVSKIAGKITEQITPAAERYFEQVREPDYEAALRAALPNWAALSAPVQTFLLTGETLLGRNNIPNYSGVMIEFANAVEALFLARWFDPFRKGHTDNDTNNKIFKDFLNFQRELTLGSVPYLLSGQEVKLHGFLQAIYDAGAYRALMDKLTGLPALLDQANIERYRNKAAHPQPRSEQDAKDARTWALQIIALL